MEATMWRNGCERRKVDLRIAIMYKAHTILVIQE